MGYKKKKENGTKARRYSNIWSITSLSFEINWSLPRPNQTLSQSYVWHTNKHTHTCVHTCSRKHMGRKWLWWHFSSKNVTCGGGRFPAEMAFAQIHAHTWACMLTYSWDYSVQWKLSRKQRSPWWKRVRYILQNTWACPWVLWGVSVLPDVNMAPNRLRHHI